MANTKNFDSSGLSNGRDMFELMQDTESQLLQNRKKLFKRLKNVNIQEIDNLNNFLLGLQGDFSKQADVLTKENVKLVKKVNSQAEIVIDNDLNQAFKVGVDKAVAEADEVLNEPAESTVQTEQIKEGAKETAKQSNITAVDTQRREFNQLAGLIIGAVFVASNLGQDKTVHEIVDNQQRKFNARGVTGKISGRRQLSLSSYNESNIREQSQTTMLASGGAVDSGDDAVYVSQHASSSSACRPHQGKRYIDDVYRQGRNPRGLNIPLLSSVVDRPGRPGLFHFNCRHTITAAPKGFDIPEAPSDAKTGKGGRVQNKKSSQTYQIEQKQRLYQRNIRQYKQVEANALTDREQRRAKQLVRNNQAKLRQLEQVAKRNNVPFYRQGNKENINFKFKTFKPEF